MPSLPLAIKSCFLLSGMFIQFLTKSVSPGAHPTKIAFAFILTLFGVLASPLPYQLALVNCCSLLLWTPFPYINEHAATSPNSREGGGVQALVALPPT